MGLSFSDEVEKVGDADLSADSPAVPPVSADDVTSAGVYQPPVSHAVQPAVSELSEDVQQDDRSHMVFMLGSGSSFGLSSHESAVDMDTSTPVRDRLDRLARRLQAFEDDRSWHSGSPSSRHGPENRRVAMLGQARGEAKVKPACELDGVREVRSSHQLCGEAWSRGSSSQCGPRSSCLGCCHPGASNDVHRGSDQREGDAGQDHGGPRTDHGGYWKWPSEHPDQEALMMKAKSRAVPTSAAGRAASAPPTPGATPMSTTSLGYPAETEEETNGSWEQLNDDVINQTAVPKSGRAVLPQVKPQAKPRAAASLEA